MTSFVRAAPKAVARPALGAAVLLGAAAALGGVAHGALPNDRNYELVSEPRTGVNMGIPASGIKAMFRSSPDGRRFTHSGAIPAGDSENGLLASFISSRPGAAGWTTAALTPRLPLNATDGSSGINLFASPVPLAMSPDVSRGLLTSAPALVPENTRPLDVFGSADLYVKTPGRPAEWFTRPLDLASQPSNKSVLQATNTRGEVLRVVFSSPEAQDTDHPGVTNGLYMWSEGDAHPHLVSFDENGDPLSDMIVSGDPVVLSLETTNAVSPDGERLVFRTTPGPPQALYVRVGDKTIKIYSEQNGAPQAFAFEGATPDLSRVYFTTSDQLPGTTAPAGGGLYEYEVPASGDAADGELTFLAPYGDASFQGGGVVAIPETGDRIYYVEHTASDTYPLIELNRATGTTKVVAELSLMDAFAQTFPTFGGVTQAVRAARVSPDGRFLVFASSAPGISDAPYDNGGFRQVFRYDAESGGKPVCLSCRADGTPSTGEGALAYFGSPSFSSSQPVRTRNVSEDGSSVFFMAADGLVPEDVNGKVDVYEWTGGKAHLISSGEGEANSYFLDASANGSDVFFTSFAELVPEHADGTQSIYDARVGAPVPSVPTDPTCEAEACQGPPSPRLPVDGAGSSAPGTGNAAPAPEVPRPPAPARLAVRKPTSAQLRTFARTGSLRLQVTAPAEGSLSATLRATVRGKARTVARASKKRARAGVTTTLTLKLSKAARTQLSRRGRLALRLTVRSGTAAGATTTTTMTLRKASTAKKGRQS